MNLTSLFAPDRPDNERRNTSASNRTPANADATRPAPTSQVIQHSAIAEGVLPIEEIRRRKLLRNQISLSKPSDDGRGIKNADPFPSSGVMNLSSVVVSSDKEDSTESTNGQALTMQQIRKRKATQLDRSLSASTQSKKICFISTVQPISLTIYILPSNRVRSRELYPDEMAMGVLYRKQTARLMKNLSISMSDAVANKLHPDPDSPFNVETNCALENMKALVRRGDYPLIRKDQAYRVIDCLKQFRHALSHNDIIYLLMHMRMCLSAVVLMTGPTMIDDPMIMNEALDKLEGLGGPCTLPKMIPICERSEVC